MTAPRSATTRKDQPMSAQASYQAEIAALPQGIEPSGRMLKIGDVMAETSLSRQSIYRFMRAGTFPRAFKLSPQRVAWRQRDIEAWKHAREIREIR